VKEIGIALLGLGNVGMGTWQILEAHGHEIERRLGARVMIRHVLVRDAKKERPAGLAARCTQDFRTILSDPGVQLVVELIGGVETAYLHVRAAIESGRHVVTANKALLSAHGEELFGRALERGVDLHFEGAVCGGIPIIRTLREALASDRIESLHGIVNGTTNLILTAMSEEGQSYAQALKRAQELGFAEADPTLDVSGADAGQKLGLLASLAFMARIRPGQIPVEGIQQLAPEDLVTAREMGYAVKLLATAVRTSQGIDARVHPALVPLRSPLADVRGGFNAVMLRSSALGPALLYGQGAGAMPTGSAVVSDVIDICRNVLAGVSGRLPMLCAPHLQDLPLLSLGERRGGYFLRFSVNDEPGVLGKIATVLGEKGVSIASVAQRLSPDPAPGATVAVRTHDAKEADIQAAVQWIDQLRSTRAPTAILRIEDSLASSS
jgi:homoserine dehydrogenase